MAYVLPGDSARAAYPRNKTMGTDVPAPPVFEQPEDASRMPVTVPLYVFVMAPSLQLCARRGKP